MSGRAVGGLASAELRRWLRSPVVVMAALVPAAAFTLLVVALTFAVGRQPIALVVEGSSPLALRLADAMRTSDGFVVNETDAMRARRQLDRQEVAAVVTVTADEPARLVALINNVDLDFADDIRRSVTEAAVEVDAPALATLGESDRPPGTLSGVPNPYRVDIAETDLRRPDVAFESYQLVAVLGLLAVTAGTVVSAVALALDRERGVLAVHAVSPTGRLTQVAGRVLGGVVASATLTLAAGVVALLVAGQPVSAARIPALTAALVLTTAAATALGVLVGSVVRSVSAAVLAGVNVAAAAFLLGGGFSTLAFLPDGVQAVAAALPTSYCVRVVRELLFYAEPQHVLRDLGALAAYAAVATLASAALLRGSPGKGSR